MPRRSSRSSPCSLTSCNEPVGSATRAVATALLSNDGSARMVTRDYAGGVGKAADWLREERRNVLGHWTAFCLECGAARRWFVELEHEVPERCACGGPILRRCPSCE